MGVFDLLFWRELFPLHVVIVFVFGAMMGSFFNVCIYRLPRGRSINRPRRSFCPACGTTIAWYDNIPLFSYPALEGLCRHCGARISSRYFWIELLTAVLFTVVFVVHGYALATPLFLLLTGFLVVSTFTDLDHWIIPDSISLGGMAVGLAAALAISLCAAAGYARPDFDGSLYVVYPFRQMGAWRVFFNAACGAAFGFLLLWTIGVLGTLAFRKEAMGMGDMKLFACIGAFLGWQACVVVLALASFLGATIGLSLLSAQWICRKLGLSPAGDKPGVSSLKTPQTDQPRPAAAAPDRPRGRQLHHLPFGPYIAVAAYVVMLYFNEIMDWMTRTFLFIDAF